MNAINATLTLTCMLHAQCIWQSWKLKGFSQPKKSCKQTHAHVKGKTSQELFFLQKKLRTNSGQARPGIITATLTLTCMLHAQCIWQSWRQRVIHNPRSPASRLMHMCRKKAGQEHFLSEKMRRNSGQARNTIDTCTATLTLTCMLHAQCIWQSWKLQGFSQPKKSCKQAERKAS